MKIVKGERRLNKVRIDMKSVPWEHWNDVYNEVVDPLVQEGADLVCQVIVIAQGEAAIKENTVELGIKECRPGRRLSDVALIVAKHGFPAGRQVDPVVEGVEIPQAIVGAVDGKFVAFFEVFEVTRLVTTKGAGRAPFEVHPDVPSAVASLYQPADAG